MAQYTVQAPDGKTVTLEGPDGASQSDVIAQAQKLYNPVPGLLPGSPNSKAAEGFAGGMARSLNPVPGIKKIASDAANPEVGLSRALKTAFIDPQVAEFSKARQAASGGGEFSGMTPSERAVSAFGHGLAGALPLVGPAAAHAGEEIGSGNTAEGLGETTGLIGSMATPDITRGVGNGLMRTAEPIAEYALGIRPVDRNFGRNPGRAALEETAGVRPATVAASAGTKIDSIARLRDAALRASPNDVDLGPSRASVDADIAKAGAGNSLTGSLEKVREHLTEPHPGFAGDTSYPPGAQQPVSFTPVRKQMGGGTSVIAHPGPSPGLTITQLQRPMDALAIRQRLGQDFTKFDAARPVSREQMAVGNKAYGNLTDAIHSAVPQSAPLDARMSNLIPVRESAKVTSLQPESTGKILTRVARPTGALIGAAEGARLGGLPGAVAGLTIPELLSSPTAQMVAARSLYGGGKLLRRPIVGQTARFAQAAGRDQSQ